jgi:hypothetical protein
VDHWLAQAICDLSEPDLKSIDLAAPGLREG